MAGGKKAELCFVIGPIGEDGSETRARSDRVLKYIIEPAAQECGYEAVRADRISQPGMITPQVIEHLRDDPLVVADLTEHNANVFYELAVRHLVRKPVVQLIEKGQPVPFDVSGSRLIRVDHRDLESAAHCKEDLVKQIRSAEANPNDVDTPISVAIDLLSLRGSNNPLAKSVDEIVELLNDLRLRMEEVYARLPTPTWGFAVQPQRTPWYGGSIVLTEPIGPFVGSTPISVEKMFEGLPAPDSSAERPARARRPRKQPKRGMES